MPTIEIAFVASMFAIVGGVFLYRRVLAAKTENARAQEIAKAIADGAQAFLRRQYITVAYVGVPILILLALLLDPWTAGGFALGALASAAAGVVGRNV